MALRYLVSGGTGNWNSTTNWSASSNGSPGASFPVAADDVIIDTGSGNANLIVNVAAACTSITFDNAHTGNLDMSAVLTVSGNVTLGALMTSTGTANIAKSGSGNMTSNGHVFSGGIIMTVGTRTLTWIDDWDILNYAGTALGVTTWSGPRIISIRGNFTSFFLNTVAGNITTARMSGTGNISLSTGGNPASASLGINTIIDTLGTCTMVAINLANCTFTYTQGNFIAGATTLNCGLGTTLDTDRTSTGGDKITFFNVSRVNAGIGNITLLTDLWMSGSLLNPVGTTTLIGVGRKIYVGANLATSFFGDPVIEMNTSTNGTLNAGSHTISIIINKTGGASVTFGGNIAFAQTGKFYTLTSGVINPDSRSATINTSLNITINGWTFHDLILATNVILVQNDVNIIQNSLTCNGNVTFQGTHGFTAQNFTCATPASIITLQNINANPLAEYTINGILTMLGTLASRITLQAAGSSTFSGTINPVGQLNYLSGVVPQTGMTISQSAGVSPVGLIGLLPNRPVITSEISLGTTFGITPAATTAIGTPFSIRAGYKAKFTLTNNGTSSQNVAYVQTQDIDSSGGMTINSFGSNGDDVNNSTISLFRTINWGPLVASSGSVYYTWVN